MAEASDRKALLAEAADVVRQKLLCFASLSLTTALAIEREGRISPETAQEVAELGRLWGDSGAYAGYVAQVAEATAEEEAKAAPKATAAKPDAGLYLPTPGHAPHPPGRGRSAGA